MTMTMTMMMTMGGNNMSINLPFDGASLRDFANSLTTGYLKPWKANSLAGTVGLMPQILEDTDRLHNLLDNALSMEGFAEQDILKIQDWIMNQMVDS